MVTGKDVYMSLIYAMETLWNPDRKCDEPYLPIFNTLQSFLGRLDYNYINVKQLFSCRNDWHVCWEDDLFAGSSIGVSQYQCLEE